MKTSALLAMTQSFVIAATFAGCIPPDEAQSDPAVDDHTGELGQSVVATGSPGSAPVPVASLTLTAGHVIEFYDFGGAALIVESGAAYTSPALNSAGKMPADQLSSIWTRLAPETPVPTALAALQQRLTSLPADPAAQKLAPASEVDGAPMVGSRTVLPAAPVGCNNGCCDEEWLYTLSQCYQANWHYYWFLVNYGWTFATSTYDVEVGGLVCSAQGTSTFSMNVGGSGGTWSVPEATYRWYHWTAGTDFWGGPIPKDMSSSVNSETNQHLHTYCGHLNHD
jgi:hypothetical protein